MQSCRDFRCPKPKQAEIRLFTPLMDNMTGKETAVLIMDPICIKIHILLQLFHLSGHGLVPL